MLMEKQDQSKGKIMVVDDHESIRNVLAQALTDEGYSVVTADDGTDALSKAASDNFDLMFLDIRMPGISGLDVLAKMTQEHPETVVVMLTAIEGDKVKTASFRHEAFAYLTKPCNLNELPGWRKHFWVVIAKTLKTNLII